MYGNKRSDLYFNTRFTKGSKAYWVVNYFVLVVSLGNVSLCVFFRSYTAIGLYTCMEMSGDTIEFIRYDRKIVRNLIDDTTSPTFRFDSTLLERL